MQNLQQFLMYALGGLVFLLIITVLVAVHELGHFWVARLCGMKVNAFAVMMGGRRVTDLSSRLERPLSPGAVVWAVGGVGLALVFGGSFGNIAPLYTLGLAVIAVIVPAWIGLRLGTLYHLGLVSTAKTLGFSWLAGMAVLGFAGGGKGIEVNQLLLVLGYASIIALIILYYQPVIKKGEDEDMGEGTLPIGGEDVPVQFRPLLSHKARSGTEYSMLLLPLGGFAAIHGMAPKNDGSETQIDGGFYSKSPLKRLATLFAGPLFSVLFGVLLVTALFTTIGEARPDMTPVISVVNPDSAAERAGLKVGDRILKVNGQKVDSFFDIIKAVRVRALLPTPIEYVREGRVATVVLTPECDKIPSPVLGSDLSLTKVKRIQGKVGISWGTVYHRLPFSLAVGKAASAPLDMVVGLLSIAREPSKAKDELGGPGTIAVAAVEATSKGIAVVLFLAAVLSISLGVMNLLPIPPLDGGQMVVAFVELLRGGRRLSIQVQQMISSGGMILVFVLMFGVLALDVNRFVGPKEKSTTTAPLQPAKSGAR
jgi:regulator of sigma E protease